MWFRAEAIKKANGVLFSEEVCQLLLSSQKLKCNHMSLSSFGWEYLSFSKSFDIRRFAIKNLKGLVSAETL